jgi:hypothetical protein
MVYCWNTIGVPNHDVRTVSLVECTVWRSHALFFCLFFCFCRRSALEGRIGVHQPDGPGKTNPFRFRMLAQLGL